MKQDFFLYQPQPKNPQIKVFLGLAILTSLVVLMVATHPSRFEVFAASVAPSPSAKASPKPSASPSVRPSASPAASPSREAATESLKDRIDRILETRQEKLRELEQSGQRRRAFIGEVQRITERTVTLHNRRGNQSFTVNTDVVLLKGGKTATIDDIAVGDWLCVIGFSDKETVQPQIVIISSTPLQPEQLDTMIGTIKSVSRTQIVVTDPKGSERTFSIVRTTAFEDVDGEVSKLGNLETETQVIVVSETSGSQSSAVTIRSLAGKR